MGQAENADGNDRNDEATNSQDAELRDAKIECTNDIFGRVLKSLDEETSKLRQFQKFPDAYQTHQGGIEEFTMRFQSDMKLKRKN